MTVDKNDNADNRTDAENASGGVKGGFRDPSGSFPKLSYAFESTVNKAARSAKRNELSIGGGLDGLGVKLPLQQMSQYPYNQVMETVAGHVIEIDDTPGGERILIKHNSGSGIEMRADGSMVMKSEANVVQSVSGSSTLIVEGDVNIKANGNLSLTVAGDLKLNVGGNIEINSGGNKTENISGSSRENVNGSMGSIVRGNRSLTTVGVQTDTTLSGKNEIIKGTSRKSVQGEAIWGVSGRLHQTSEGEMAISSPNMNIAASNLSVFGASGTIGGSGIVHYGVTYYGTSFYGDLVGTASKSLESDVTHSQSYPGVEVGSSPGYSVTDDGTETAAASSGLMNSYLNESANGTIKISIDEGDHIKNSIDRTVTNDGISEKELNTREIRSALREPANMANNTFVGNAVSAGKISGTYSKTVPSSTGRIYSKSPAVRIPTSGGLNATTDNIKRYKPAKEEKATKIIPDPIFDPNNFTGTITPELNLAKGVKLSKFLGATGDKVTLGHISTNEEKLQLARQYYVQAQAYSTILNNTGEFKDFRLVVVEGLYKKGPNEKITANSNNDLAMKGRTVVYELHDEKGQISLEKTFDLAAYWKDMLKFEKLILSYDTFNPDGSMTAQIILCMPEFDADYNVVGGKYSNIVETHYNNNVLGTDLIEALTS